MLQCFGDGCVSLMNSLQVQKSPGPYFGQNPRNSYDISRGFLHSGMWKFDPSEVSQAVRRLKTLPSVTSEMPANGGLLRIDYRSPGSEIGRCGSEIAQSLQTLPRIFPFSGDGRAGDKVRSPLCGGHSLKFGKESPF